MIRINLLPIRQTRKLEAARRELLLAVGGGGVVLVVGLAIWSLLWLQLRSAKSHTADLQTEIDRLAADVAKVEELERFKAELQKKVTVIDELRAQKIGPVHMLDELAMATPEKLQLTNVSERSKELTITGVSVTNEVISQFLRSLDASEYFEQVYLQNIEAVPPAKNMTVTLKSFRLTARLVAPKVPGAEAAGKDKKPAETPKAPGGGT